MYRELIEKIDSNKKFFSRELVLVCKLSESLREKINEDEIYISEFIVAKIFGYIPKLIGHEEVTKDFFLNLPTLLNNPRIILRDKTVYSKIFIICGEPTHRVVLEIKRRGLKTEINTIHRIRDTTLEKLIKKSIIL